MKTASVILKILAALAAIAGIVYVIATYGDKIVAWAKGLLGKCKCGCDCECDECDCECECDDCECECECDCDCDETIEEVAVEEAVEASDADFEG